MHVLHDPARVPETLSVQEVAHHAAHEHGEEGHSDSREWVIEVVEALLLAIVAVATAWSGYQAARWDGKQAELYGISSREHALETQASTRNGQFRLYDATNFSFWLESVARGDNRAEALFRRRFRPEFVPAFRAWLATRPFTHPSAPAGPQVMPQYKVAQDRGAAVHGARAEALRGRHPRARAGRALRPRHDPACDGAVPDGARPALQGARAPARADRRLARPARGRALLHRHLSPRLMLRRASSEKKIAGGNRAQAVQEWLRRRADTPVGRLSLQWFRAYFAASRNSGCAIRSTRAVGAADGARHRRRPLRAGRRHQRLRAAPRRPPEPDRVDRKLVEDTFGSASSNALAASVATAVSFLIWGIGIGQLYQDVYGRAWGVTVRSQAADQGRYAIFFFVFSGALALSTIGQAELGDPAAGCFSPRPGCSSRAPSGSRYRCSSCTGRSACAGCSPARCSPPVVLGGAAAFSPLFPPAP